MSRNWYYAKDGARVGPVEFAKLKRLVRSGALQPRDMVWNEGAAVWVPVEAVPALVHGSGPIGPDKAAASQSKGPAADSPKQKSGWYNPLPYACAILLMAAVRMLPSYFRTPTPPTGFKVAPVIRHDFKLPKPVKPWQPPEKKDEK